MTSSFPTLFQPITIGSVEIPNRVVSTGHDTTLIHQGKVTDALIAYQEARAAGGAGLIVTQVAGVHETARYTSHILMAVSDEVIEGYTRLTAACHKHGAKVFAQLFHPGREIMETQDGTAPVSYAPSVSPSERFHTIPRALTVKMIGEIVDGYAAAAVRLKSAGADGVEIVASHAYLPAQFLSAAVNRREDAYGGSEEKRRRFLEEIIAGVRAAVGTDFVVGLRISGDEHDPEGMGVDVSLRTIKALANAIDYVSVVAGSSASLGGASHIVPPMAMEHGYVAPFAAAVKATLKDHPSIPVMVTGRINQPQIAEQVLTSGQADLCGMTRALICDPEMPNKAAASQPDEIRACIGCNQACIGHFHKGYPISCIQHPETGREVSYGTVTPTAEPKRVMVIGGGPAGLKAAAIAAERGHEVELYEASARLGGQALLAQLLPGRSEFGGIITNLTREAERAGVKITTNQAVDRAMVEQSKPDAVIIATGAQPRWPQGAELDESAHVVNAWQVLSGEANVGASVVIADWKSDWIGLGLAQKLAEDGCKVRLAINGLHAGETIPFYVRDIAVGKAQSLGVEIIPYSRLYGADGDTVYLQHTANQEAVVLEAVDTLVLAQGHEPVDGLIEVLENYAEDHGCQVIAAGDCLAARTAEEAVLEGMRAGWAVW
jgi:2,4-dienoyl-CoA reductase-like NADH-dependent reductase (Old Yellow Enzyme family)/thioredoxin reductase